MKPIDTRIAIDGENLILKPVVSEKEIQLYDIYLGEKWCGSRRTVDACGMIFDIPGLVRVLWDERHY